MKAITSHTLYLGLIPPLFHPPHKPVVLPGCYCSTPPCSAETEHQAEWASTTNALGTRNVF